MYWNVTWLSNLDQTRIEELPVNGGKSAFKHKGPQREWERGRGEISTCLLGVLCTFDTTLNKSMRSLLRANRMMWTGTE